MGVETCLGYVVVRIVDVIFESLTQPKLEANCY